MKFTKFFAFVALATVAFVGCEPQEQIPDTSGSLTLKADKTAVAMGETVTFTVEQKAEDGTVYDVTSQSIIYDNDLNPVEGGKYTFEATGTYAFFATKGSENSNYVNITVMGSVPEIPDDPQPENLAFNHRAVVIDHTGVNCGYCPGMTDKLLALAETEWHKHYNEVTCHAGGMANGDPGNSAAANALNAMQAPTGYPNIKINFYTATVDNYGQATFLNYMAQALGAYIKKGGADVGISLAVEGDPTAVYCAAQVKSAIAKEYKAVAWLLENNIYSPTQAGATKDYHKIYNYALRNISGEYSKSNVAGEPIGYVEAGQTVDLAFTLPIVSNKWEYENMGVLVIVSARDANNRWEIVNSAYCPMGEAKAYEYVE